MEALVQCGYELRRNGRGFGLRLVKAVEVPERVWNSDRSGSARLGCVEPTQLTAQAWKIASAKTRMLATSRGWHR